MESCVRTFTGTVPKMSPPAAHRRGVGGSTVGGHDGRADRGTVSLYDAKTHLSTLVERAADGEEIVISKSGKPKARLVPLDDPRPLRGPGRGRGRWTVADDFDDPLPDDVLADFGEG